MSEFKPPGWVDIEREAHGNGYMLRIDSQTFSGSFELSDTDGNGFELNVNGSDAMMSFGPFTAEELYGLGIVCQAEGGYSDD